MLADVLFRTEPPHQGPRGIEPAALELGDRPPAHLVRAVAEELLRPRAPVRDATPHVGRDDSCGRMLRDGAEEVPDSARLLGEPRAPDRERGLADDPLEKLPVVDVEVERRLAVQREHAEERPLVDDRHDVGTAEAVLPEPVHREDASVREDVRDHDRLAVRGDPARQAIAEPEPAPGVRRGEVLDGEGARIERPRRLVGDPEPDRWRLHQLRSRARDLAEHVVEVRGGRDDARQPDENLEAGELPVGRLLELAEPGELGLRGLQAEGLTPPRASSVRAEVTGSRAPDRVDGSEGPRRASEVLARACVDVLPRAGAGAAAVGTPGVHEAAAGRVRAAA